MMMMMMMMKMQLVLISVLYIIMTSSITSSITSSSSSLAASVEQSIDSNSSSTINNNNTNNTVLTDGNMIAAHWDNINRPWVTWPGYGYCRNNQSLLSDISHDICYRRVCLWSSVWQRFVIVDRLKEYDEGKNTRDWMTWKGKESDCRYPMGGQLPSRNMSNDSIGIKTDANQPKLPKATVEVSFIYSIHNNPSMVATSLLEIFRTAHETSSAEYILIDDGSTEDMMVLNRLVKNLRNIFGIECIQRYHPISKGYTISVSEGMRLASGTYAMLLNTDVFVLPGWLRILLRTMIFNAGGHVGMVGPMMIFEDGLIAEAGGGLFRGGVPFNSARGYRPLQQSLLHARIVDYVSAACILVRRQLFVDFNLYNPKYSPAYYEDTDAALVFAEHGWQTILQPFSVVIHAEGSTYGTDGVSMVKKRQMLINSKLFRDLHGNTLNHYCPGRNSSEFYPTVMLHMGMSFYRQPNRILVLEMDIPEPDRDAGSIRLLELLRLLVDLRYSVTLETQPHMSCRVSYKLNVLSEGIGLVMPGTLSNMAIAVNFRKMKGRESYCPWDAIIIARRDIFSRHYANVKIVCPHIPIIFDTVDVHFLREIRMNSVGHHPSSKALAAKSMGSVLDSMRLELGHVVESNITFVVSTTEKSMLTGLLSNAADVRILSNIYRLPDEMRVFDAAPNVVKLSTFDSRSGAVFVGSMCHQPNIDAVDFIVRQILSLENQFPAGFKVHMVWSRSRACKDPILGLAEAHPMVVVHRDISNDELLALHNRVKLALAPLRYGAGVKGKVNYALLHGVPVIATSIAAEGMGLVDGYSYLQADSGQQFADAIKKIYGDEMLFLKLAKNGEDLMRSMFGYNVAKRIVQTAFVDLKVPAPNQQPHVCNSLSSSDWVWAHKNYFPLFPRLRFAENYLRY